MDAQWRKYLLLGNRCSFGGIFSAPSFGPLRVFAGAIVIATCEAPFAPGKALQVIRRHISNQMEERKLEQAVTHRDVVEVQGWSSTDRAEP